MEQTIINILKVLDTEIIDLKSFIIESTDRDSRYDDLIKLTTLYEAKIIVMEQERQMLIDLKPKSEESDEI